MRCTCGLRMREGGREGGREGEGGRDRGGHAIV